MGGKISSSLFGICIVLLLSYLLWELAKTAIDRRLEAEGKQGAGQSRRRACRRCCRFCAR